MYNHNLQTSQFSSKIQQNQEISVEQLQQQVSLCLAQNSRLKEALKRSRDQQLTSKKQYDSMFRELQIEQCRLMLTIEEQNNQIKKMAREITHSANQSTKNVLRQKDFLKLQEQVEELTNNLQRIRNSKLTQKSGMQQDIVIMQNLITELESQKASLHQIQTLQKAKIVQLEHEIKIQAQRITVLQMNEQKLKKTYQYQINQLQQQHDQITSLLQSTKQQQVYTTQNQQTQQQLQRMINKVRDTNKQLVDELDLKTMQAQRLIQQIQNLKQYEIDIQQQHQKQKAKISQNLDQLMKGFNEQIINYQNKILFLLEYLEEVEMGKADKIEQMRGSYQKLKDGLGNLIKRVVKI